MTSIIYYRDYTIIVYITASFILPLTRLHSDDPGLRARLEIWDIVIPDSSQDTLRRLVTYTLHRYLYYYVFILRFVPISVSITVTDSLAGIIVLIYAENYCVYSIYSLYWSLAYIRKGISTLRIYLAITSPYPQDQSVTKPIQTTALIVVSKTYSALIIATVPLSLPWVLLVFPSTISPSNTLFPQ